jgi:hypothetical protein
MKTLLLVLLVIGGMGFVIYKKNDAIRDLKAEVEECERKIGQLESELSRLKTAPPPPPQNSALGRASGTGPSTPPPAQSPSGQPSGNWMWDKNRAPSPLDAPAQKH